MKYLTPRAGDLVKKSSICFEGFCDHVTSIIKTFEPIEFKRTQGNTKEPPKIEFGRIPKLRPSPPNLYLLPLRKRCTLTTDFRNIGIRVAPISKKLRYQ